MREEGVDTYSAGLKDGVDGGQQTESYVVDAGHHVHQQERYAGQCDESRVDYQVEDPTQSKDTCWW